MWDKENRQYYLQSRYYNSFSGRFISSDEVEYLGTQDGIKGYNLFLYCIANPANMVDYNGKAPINFVLAALGGIVGWKFGEFVANALGYHKGDKFYYIVKAGVAAGGAAIGWVSATLLSRIVLQFFQKNPHEIFRLFSKYGINKVKPILSFIGINPFTLSLNSSKFIELARNFNNKSITLSYNWAVALYRKAVSLGYQVTLDNPHGGYGWHLHLSGSHGKLKYLHIQVTKGAWNYISKCLNR